MKVLLVEDHLPTRQMISRSLESQGHAVDGVGRMADGLNRAGESRFDSIIIDIELPDGTGLDLCREVRRRGVRTPILFLTARGEVEDRVSGLDAGADDYLKKPFALAELHARLRALVRRAHTRAPQVIEGPGWKIDFGRRRLKGGDTEIPLTAREWSLLEQLADRRGQLVNRTLLLEAAWGDATPAASDSLDVIVSRLRRKLAQLPGGPSIRTLRAQGYIFELTA